MSRAAGDDVGTYALTQGTLSAGNNYTITFVSANFSITTRPITVTADDKSKFLGDPDPAFTFSDSGFVGLDTFTTEPTCTVSGSHNLEGTYPIACSGAVVGSNYTVSYVDGTLTVGPVTTEANIDVRIHAASQASYVLSQGQSTRQRYTGVNNGPVEVSNTGILPITAAERVIYKVNKVNTSFLRNDGLARCTTRYDLLAPLVQQRGSGYTIAVWSAIKRKKVTFSMPFCQISGRRVFIYSYSINSDRLVCHL